MATNVSRVISGCSAGPPMMYGITRHDRDRERRMTPVKPVAVRLHRLTGTGVTEGSASREPTAVFRFIRAAPWPCSLAHRLAAGEQPARPDREHGEEQQVDREHRVRLVDLADDHLGDAREPRRRRACPTATRCRRSRPPRTRRSARSVPVSGSKVPIVPMKTPARAAVATAMPATVANTGRTRDAHQPGGVQVVGGRAHLAAPRGVRQQQLQAGQDRARGEERGQEQPGHGDAAADVEAGQRQRRRRSARAGRRSRPPAAGSRS